ncbi:MAG: hypothetical protein JWQ27_436 [Ferruginibacter sp.]|nr:hypothetical protein [Ferruginibacter sp.]
MKKLLVIVITACAFAACSENKTTETTTTNSSDPAKMENTSRANQMADSTKMLDKLLADSSNKMTPDSLK